MADNPHYPTDNVRVFHLLKDAISDHKSVLAWVKDYNITQDGRETWKAFRAHYLGDTQLDSLANRAENWMASTKYAAERARYNFEKHVTVHQKCHSDIEKATGTALTDRDKVRRFLWTLTADFMTIPKATIEATNNLRTNWTDCINYLRKFVPEKPQFPTQDLNISKATIFNSNDENDDESVTIKEANIHKKRKKDKGKGPSNLTKKQKEASPKIEIRKGWYSNKEMKAIKEAGRWDEVLELREREGIGKHDKNKNNVPGTKQGSQS